jgi:hypothetical protein
MLSSFGSTFFLGRKKVEEPHDYDKKIIDKFHVHFHNAIKHVIHEQKCRNAQLKIMRMAGCR